MYFSQGLFAEPRFALLNVPYVSRRGAGGWVTQSISPPYTEYQGHALYSEFGESLFTEDLSRGVVEGFDTPLVSGQPAGYVNLYVADIETGSYEPVTTVAPPEAEYLPFSQTTTKNGDTIPEAVGASSDLSHVVFQFKASLCCGASPKHTHVYEEAGGVLRQVDVPPEGGKLEGEDNVGAAAASSWPENSGDPWRAVSGDGSRVVFTGGEKDIGFSSPLAGQVYVRENPLSGVDGCSVAGGACTVEVSASERTNEVTGKPEPDPNAGKGPLEGTAWYRGASVDGSRVFFTSRVELTNDADTREDNAANLYECEIVVEHEKCKLRDLTPENAEGGGVLGLVTASEDGSYVYFVAEGVLTNGKNGEGGKPVAGQPNLYLSRGGSVSFIATLAPRAGGGEFPGFANALGNGNGDEEDWLGEEKGGTGYDFGPGKHSVRVSGDGSLLVFTSELDLTGFDNRPVAAGECEGELCREVYLFDAVSGRLVCLSCGVGRPVGPSALGGHESMGANDLGESSPFYVARNISGGGGRVFFQSVDALVPQDSNGLLDVYEWELPGVGSCTESLPAFRVANDGCVFPVSNVAGGSESFFMDASGSGDDVFIATADQLVSSDTDSREDVYDVRVGGGFSVMVAPPVCVNGDSCKPPVSLQPGVFGVPASATFGGAGNLVSSSSSSSSSRVVCARSKRLVRGRCVAKKKKKRKVKARRAGKARYAAGKARGTGRARAGRRGGVVS